MSLTAWFKRYLVTSYFFAYVITWGGILWSIGQSGFRIFTAESVFAQGLSGEILVVWLSMLAGPSIAGLLMTRAYELSNEVLITNSLSKRDCMHGYMRLNFAKSDRNRHSRRRFLKYAAIGIVVAVVGLAVTECSLLTHKLQGSFGIYLLENNKLVISDEDIVWYNRTSHEIRLTEPGVKKIEGLQISLHGSPFVIRINGEKIYNGVFVTPISSISQPPSELVMETAVQNNTIKLQMGYPPSQSGAEDPRNDPRILDYFQNIKKLVQ